MSTPWFRLFAQACLGVVVGVLLAVGNSADNVSGRRSAEHHPGWTALLDLVEHLVEASREGILFVVTRSWRNARVISRPTRYCPGELTARNLWLALILSVPIGNLIIASTFGGASFLIPGFAALCLGTVLASAAVQAGQTTCFDWTAFRRSTRHHSKALALFCDPCNNDLAVDSLIICGGRGKNRIECSSCRPS